MPLRFAPGSSPCSVRFGAGEAPISVSGDPARRPAGADHPRRGRCHARPWPPRPPGTCSPFAARTATGWDVRDGLGGDIIIVAGGIGLAPLRSAILDVLAHRDGLRPGRAAVRRAACPAEQLYPGELADWARPAASRSAVTVDRAEPGWPGPVGLVTSLIPAARFDPARALALVCGPEVMMRFVAAALRQRGHAAPGRSGSRWNATWSAASACVATASFGSSSSAPTARCSAMTARRPDDAAGGVTMAAARPKLAVWKFASCDGCQLTLLNCEDELLTVAEQIEIAYFPEATRGFVAGPYDLSLVEGSITTPRRRRADPGGAPGVAAGWSPSAPAPPAGASRHYGISLTWLISVQLCMRIRSTSPPWSIRRPSRRMSRSISSCTAAPSTRGSCLRCSARSPSDRKPRIPGGQRVRGVQAARDWSA